MQRVNTYQLYQLSLVLTQIKNLQASQTIDDVELELFQARTWLQWFLQGKVIPLSVSRQAVQQLLRTIAELIPPDFPASLPADPKQQLDYQAGALARQSRDLETVLAAELQVVDTYFIDKKGIYVTSDLIEHAELAFSQSVRSAIHPDAVSDFKESGKCLAFDLATASGFHSMRAVETVLRQWHGLVCKPTQKKKLEMAGYIGELRGYNADAGTLGILDQIRDLHRNPVMHPEDFLTVDEALILFDIAKSAISAMGEQIVKVSVPTLPATTTP